MNDISVRVEKLSFLQKGPYSFNLNKGECVGLSGPSGIGKTQLFRAMTDLITSSGAVSLNGVMKESMSAPLWRTRVMMVPSESYWWFDRVGDHFNPPSPPNFNLENGCNRLGLPKEILSYQVSRLSTGEKQRLALLRALQCYPEVMLLDEPTSGLDEHHTAMVESLLNKERNSRNLTLMWVSHDPKQLGRVAEKVLYMNEKELVMSHGG